MAVKFASVTTLRGLGDSFATKLEKLGIYTKLDLALHLPSRYQDRTTFTPLEKIVVGEEYFTQGIITNVRNSTTNNELLVEFNDDSADAIMRLIHFSPYNVQQFQIGKWLRVYGQLRRGRQFIHPEYRVFSQDPGAPDPYYHPIYPTTSGISSNRLRNWILQSLPELSLLPRYTYAGLTLQEALATVHEPDPKRELQDTEIARKRIAFDEILAFFLLQRKLNLESRRGKTFSFSTENNITDLFLKNLPFELTDSQRNVLNEVEEDLRKPVAMRRLLQGDVGSGKTVVAVLASLRAAGSGFQTAVMAPTEILVEQHFETFSEWLEPLGINISLLTSRMPAKSRRRSEEAILSGDNLIAVGTHSLFQRNVQFKNLGLAIIDEQHRFGVHQRMQLRGKGNNPHQLIMTATPIPRTLALTFYKNLDVSTIKELPKGRPPIHTSIHSTNQRQQVIDAIGRQLLKDRQVYWVCQSIEDNPESKLEATESVVRELTHKLPDVEIGHIHGRMKTSQKSSIMHKFRSGKIRLLIATTVIEVGIDVPNASIMVIENADHLGLAQLHQLRGRIGRGSIESYCMLLYDPDPGLSDVARERLRAVQQHRDGFKLAELDFQLRGQGMIFGVRQSGTEHFRTADSSQIIEFHVDVERVLEELSQSDSEIGQRIIDTWTSSDPGYVAV